MKWTPKHIDTAIRELQRGPTVVEACKRMSARFATNVTHNNLEVALQRRGKKAAVSYLPKPGIAKTIAPPPHVAPAPPADPVQVQAERKDARATKSELERLIELLRIERERNAYLNVLAKPRPHLTIPRRERTSRLREMTAIVLASDWHPEEEVSPVKVQGRNKYTLAIADLRIKRFFQGIVDLVQHHRASGKVVIRDLVLALMGDLMTGHIHEDCKHLAALFPIETILWLTPRLHAGIQFLLDELDLVSLSIPCDIGNHGRTTEYRNIATGPETSYEWGMYCQLAREFAGDPRVHFDTSPANDHYTEIYDFRLHTTHGDSFRYAGGVGGLTIPALKAAAAWDSDILSTWHAFGHYHTSLDLDKIIGNGSMIGWGAYSKWIRCRYNPRDLSQHFSLVDSRQGRCHSTPLWVSSPKEEWAFWTKEERAMVRPEERALRGVA